MTEEKQLQKYGEEYRKLKNMCIYELWQYCRKNGIFRPDARTKEELIRSVLKIAPDKESVKKTTMQFTFRELKILAELVYMGYYVANGFRKECVENQFAVSSAVYREYAALKNNIADKFDIEDNEIADIRDELCTATEEYIEFFEKNLLFEKKTHR